MVRGTARGQGRDVLDAPVSGGPAGADAGTLTVMVGGDEQTFERAVPVFEAFGAKIRRCGPVGSGQAIKLVNQLLVAVHTMASAEAAAMAVQLGADLATVQDVIGTSAAPRCCCAILPGSSDGTSRRRRRSG